MDILLGSGKKLRCHETDYNELLSLQDHAVTVATVPAAFFHFREEPWRVAQMPQGTGSGVGDDCDQVSLLQLAEPPGGYALMRPGFALAGQARAAVPHGLSQHGSW
jgi:hypothetical protein